MTDSKLAETTKAVGKLFGTAAQLAQKQAALATLNNVTLPKLYHAIGKKIASLEKLPPDLVPHREKIRALEAGINTKPEELPAAPAEGFAAKAKHLAQQAAQKASKATADAAATMQIQAAYVGLGKEAVEKYGDRPLLAEHAEELRRFKRAKEALSVEIDTLASSSYFGWFTPKRILYGCLACGCMALALIMWPSGSTSPKSSDTEQRLAADGESRSSVEEQKRFVSQKSSVGAVSGAGETAASLGPPSFSEESLGDLPEHLERHRAAVATLRRVYIDTGRADVSMDELVRAMNVLANGTMLNGTKSQVERLLAEIQQAAKDTGKGMDQILAEMAEHKTTAMSSGLSEAYAERSYPEYYKNTPARAGTRPKMICPSCKGTGNTNPDNPGSGSTCLFCAGTGMRNVGQ